MGEAAEMMLEGWFCQGCGDLMCDPADGPQGFPGFCSPECAGEQPAPSRGRKHFKCPYCKKVLRTERGHDDHVRMKHGDDLEL